MDLNTKIQNFLDKEYNKNITSKKISTYKISDCGPPWVGAMLSHMVFCHNVAYQNNFSFQKSKDDFWRMIQNDKFSDVFNSLIEVDDSNFDINNFLNANNTRFSYNVNRRLLDNFFREDVKMHLAKRSGGWRFFRNSHKNKHYSNYFYPKGLESLVNSNDKIILSDIWKSFLLKRIYKLTEKYENYVNEKLENIPKLKNYAAIHIRRGDKVSGPIKESNFIETVKYFETLERSNYNFDSIFISTDSIDALNECITLYGKKYHLIYDSTEIRHDGFPLKVINNSIDINEHGETELITALKNFSILKNSNVLIGTPASWFFRISMLLRPYTKIKDVLYSEDIHNIPGYPTSYYHC